MTCRACGRECADPPTPQQPLTLECPDCNGRGCDLCDDGEIVLARCPHKCVPADMWTVMRDAQNAIKGAWPVGGGTYDQSAPFVHAVEFVDGEINRIQRSKRAK